MLDEPDEHILCTTFISRSRIEGSRILVTLCLTNGEKGIIMSQQEMGYSEMDRDRPGFSYGAYEDASHYNMHGGKLSGQGVKIAPTPGQRLALAIASLVMLMILIFGLIGMAIATQARPWVIAPILIILVLFSSVAVIINIVFNRKS